MKQVSFNSAKLDSSIVIEAECRRVDTRDNAERLARTQTEVLKVKFAANNSKDHFVKDFVVDSDKRNLNQRRGADAYGADNLRARLSATRESLISSRDSVDANKSLAFRHGMNQLALA